MQSQITNKFLQMRDIIVLHYCYSPTYSVIIFQKSVIDNDNKPAEVDFQGQNMSQQDSVRASKY